MRHLPAASNVRPDVTFLSERAWDYRRGIPKLRGWYLVGRRTVLAGPYRSEAEAEQALARVEFGGDL